MPKRTLAIFLGAIVVSGNVQSEEMVPVVTALSHTTLSGYVNTSAIWRPYYNPTLPGSWVSQEIFEKMIASAALNDGLPSSTSALLADSAFETFAFAPSSSWRGETNKYSSGFQNIRFLGGVTEFHDIDGEQYNISAPGRLSLTERFSLGWNFNFSRAEQARESIDRAGLTVGLPISILRNKTPWNWELSPFAGFLWGRSERLFAGGYGIHFGLAQSISWDRDWFSIRMGNQIGGMAGARFEENNVTYDPNIDQQITKNGLEIIFRLCPDFSLKFFGIHTYFLQDAVIDQYGTVGSSVGYSFGKDNWAKVELGICSDFGNHYKALSGTVGFGFTF